MYKLMFVCHGNICRSPMAEFVMKTMVKEQGLAEEFEIQSSAVSDEEIGNPVHYKAAAMLASKGISCKGKTARRITKEDGSYYDYILIMDDSNKRLLNWIINKEDMSKVHLLLSFAGEARDIDDPWYTGNFTLAYNDIYKGCAALLQQLKRS